MDRMKPPSQIGWALLLAALIGCGGTLPPRYVVERDVGSFFYRRYQRTLDVEFVIAGNSAVGHTATYLRRGAHGTDFATAFVTVYTRPSALTAEVREQLESLEHYHFEVQEQDGEAVFALDRDDERWVVWVSGRHVVKLGAPRGEVVPEDLVEAYMDVYPSDLDQHGRARAGTESRGPSKRERHKDEATEPSMPQSLRPNAAR
jgi:hypothetical protein